MALRPARIVTPTGAAGRRQLAASLTLLGRPPSTSMTRAAPMIAITYDDARTRSFSMLSSIWKSWSFTSSQRSAATPRSARNLAAVSNVKRPMRMRPPLAVLIETPSASTDSTVNGWPAFSSGVLSRSPGFTRSRTRSKAENCIARMRSRRAGPSTFARGVVRRDLDVEHVAVAVAPVRHAPARLADHPDAQSSDSRGFERRRRGAVGRGRRIEGTSVVDDAHGDRVVVRADRDFDLAARLGVLRDVGEELLDDEPHRVARLLARAARRDVRVRGVAGGRDRRGRRRHAQDQGAVRRADAGSRRIAGHAASISFAFASSSAIGMIWSMPVSRSDWPTRGWGPKSTMRPPRFAALFAHETSMRIPIDARNDTPLRSTSVPRTRPEATAEKRDSIVPTPAVSSRPVSAIRRVEGSSSTTFISMAPPSGMKGEEAASDA